MQKTVTAGMRNTTVTLDGTECAVKFSDNYRYFEILNESGGDVTVSVYEGKNAGDDGVMNVHTGTSATLAHMQTNIDTVYVNGSGTVQIAAKNSGEAVFKTGSKGGGSANVTPANKLTPYKIDEGWDIQPNGISHANSECDIPYYVVQAYSMIYIKANDNTNECKYCWLNVANVSSNNTNHLVGNPVLTATDGTVIVPEGAKFIGFSQHKTDTKTGVYALKML